MPKANDDKEMIIYIPGNAIRFKYTNPFGFIKVSYEKGQVPQALSGWYTSRHEAKTAVVNYCQEKRLEMSDTPIEIPEIKYKQPKKEATAVEA